MDRDKFTPTPSTEVSDKTGPIYNRSGLSRGMAHLAGEGWPAIQYVPPDKAPNQLSVDAGFNDMGPYRTGAPTAFKGSE